VETEFKNLDRKYESVSQSEAETTLEWSDDGPKVKVFNSFKLETHKK